MSSNNEYCPRLPPSVLIRKQHFKEEEGQACKRSKRSRRSRHARNRFEQPTLHFILVSSDRGPLRYSQLGLEYIQCAPSF